MTGFRSIEDLGLTPSHRGKVRETIDLGDRLLMITTDRISAFDCILPDPLPGKGVVLNEVSEYWFRGLESFLPNHLLSTQEADLPAVCAPHKKALKGRWMLVQKASRIPVECVVRGYLAGSAWGEYRRTGAVQGHDLPPGLREFGQLPAPIFTPTTKEESGHDQPLTREGLLDRIGKETAEELERWSVALYQKAAGYARARGLALADTKFEFGWIDGRLSLIDEVLTPDSSRYWTLQSLASSTVRGGTPESLDKQYVRDYLLGLDWDRNPPAPALPPRVAAEAMRRYKLAWDLLRGGTRTPDWRLVKE